MTVSVPSKMFGKILLILVGSLRWGVRSFNCTYNEVEILESLTFSYINQCCSLMVALLCRVAAIFSAKSF